MAVPNDIAVAERLAAQGYFTKAAQGDARAASLFVRLFAYTANPEAKPSSWGWLKKGGGHQIDGYAEDAVVYGNNPADLHNVVDLVIGTGAPNAKLVPTTSVTVQRRPSDTWEAPRALTAAELAYLGGSGTLPPPGPVCPDPSAHQPKPLPPYPSEPGFWHASGSYGGAVKAAYQEAFTKGLRASPDPDWNAFVWFARPAYAIATGALSAEQAARDYVADLRRQLGL